MYKSLQLHAWNHKFPPRKHLGHYMFLGGQWVFWGASGFSDSLAPRASGCHSPMSRPGSDRKRQAQKDFFIEGFCNPTRDNLPALGANSWINTLKLWQYRHWLQHGTSSLTIAVRLPTLLILLVCTCVRDGTIPLPMSGPWELDVVHVIKRAV